MPLLKFSFKFLIILVIYIFIFWALKIMYKDIKGSNRKKRRTSKVFGLEVVKIEEANQVLKIGSLIPVKNILTIGRREDNLLILQSQYISGYHAKIYVKNNEFFIEDLNSTNGTKVNNKIISKPTYLKSGDEISIGEYGFKVIS